MVRVLILCGSTASGKSKVALELAPKINGEIVSADSQQVWRGLDIGTAKPSLGEQKKIPHHLIDVVGPGDKFDVSQYVTLADQAIKEIRERDKLPLVVGGTGMYLRVLLHGLCEAPPQDKAIRQKLTEEMQKFGLPVLFERLQKIDPDTIRKIHPNDPTRIIRSLEVYEMTGYPLSHFHEKHCVEKPRYEALQIGIDCDRKILGEKIDARVDAMLKSGWLEEVRGLLKIYTADSQAMQSIGYKQLIAHLQGRYSLEEAIAEIKKQTKAYAKRQMTWFRSDKSVKWINPENAVAFILRHYKTS